MAVREHVTVPGLIPENIITQVLESTDIADLVGRYFPLRRAGQGFVALCPFHNEKTPSFHVSPQRQNYHCFGCGKGGNAIGFLMEMEKVPFPEAVEILADRCGVRIERTEAGRKVAEKRNDLYDLMARSATLFEKNLQSPNGSEARSYLDRRGITAESIRLFRLGYSMPGWDDLLTRSRAAGINASALEAAGLLIRKQNDDFYDRFRNRLMFPIFDAQERVVGFGARALDPEEKAKYLNSPETTLFSKGKLLYGLNMAKSAMMSTDIAVVVEGYTDVIMAHQCGFTNVVATLGTALGRDHIRRLRRYAQRCVLVYDGDAAGQKASDASLQTFVEEEMDVSVAILPEGKDPCDCLVEMGPDVFARCLETASDLYEFKLRHASRNAKDPKAVAALVDEILSLVARVPNIVERRLRLDGAAKLASERLRVPEASIRRRFAEIANKQRRPATQTGGEQLDNAAEPMPVIEQELLTVCLQQPELFENISNVLTHEDFTHQGCKTIYIMATELLAEDGRVEPTRLSARIVDPESAALLAKLHNSNNGSNDFGERLESCLKNMERRKTQQRLLLLREQMILAAREGDADKQKRLVQEYQLLQKTQMATTPIRGVIDERN